MSSTWPVAQIDAVQRLRALASGVRGAAVSERLIDAPLDEVWATLTDFTGDFCRIVPDIHKVDVLEERGVRVVLRARNRIGFRARMVGRIDNGLCWLQSRFLIVGFAATAETAGSSRVAITLGIRIPQRAALVPLGVRREGNRALGHLAEVLAAPNNPA